jgi:hypothetical protein
MKGATMNEAQLKKAVLKAVEETNFCTKHRLYHGKKYKSCRPEKRVVVEIKPPKDTK